ncbi:hypothetical protein PILCRDRAFT_15965 [Piloderma croceum F 1598]|uniref:HNH nuclease domain-containing protein n=1 Tax=Piloderma croceum (strain F 1598) TaxID=765440 RepID=A0A0C3EY31_PILCF|nr:hypothetical protein PILCRDRAFT_15965 [Piloderma croceum F 1598]
MEEGLQQVKDRDPSDDSQSFKMRLIYRDKGCAVCLAAGIQEIYEYLEDSNCYEGSYIVDFAYNELWDARGFSALVSDPFTDRANAENQFASPSTRTMKDLRRINSLENGMLLCLQHYRDYDNFRFSINPDVKTSFLPYTISNFYFEQTHEIFSFHPATAKLRGVRVKAPWDRRDVLYPPPHPVFLEMHYFTSISKAMEGSGTIVNWMVMVTTMRSSPNQRKFKTSK